MNCYSQFWLDYANGVVVNIDKEFEIRDFIQFIIDEGHISLFQKYFDARWKEIKNGERDNLEVFKSAV